MVIIITGEGGVGEISVTATSKPIQFKTIIEAKYCDLSVVSAD